jgi:hypothetical protein
MEPELGRNDNEDLKFIKSLVKEGKGKEFEWVSVYNNTLQVSDE